MSALNVELDTIVSLCKRRGFIFPGSEIYGGLAGTYDYGPLGTYLKENIRQSWLTKFVCGRPNMYPLDAAILMNAKVWETSGHVSGFSDPMVECGKCKRRFRADQITDVKKCEECGGPLSEARQFNMMFKTHAGAVDDSSSVTYLRPETAQGIFVNFKNVLDTMRPKLPFGIAQIGKAFRNEITPRDFLFRVREFEQMEIEFFVTEDSWKDHFESLKSEALDWLKSIGLDMAKVKPVEVPTDSLAHYSKRTVDVEFEYPFGYKELFGIAYRYDYDLSKHAEATGEKLEIDGAIPHVIEPSFGIDRMILAVLCSAYREDELGGEKRVYLALKPSIAPFKAAVFPLLKNKPGLVAKAKEVWSSLAGKVGNVDFDDNGNIGKRYRRQDEIGTPFCITVDFDTLGEENAELKDTVTVRDRDTGKQERMKIAELPKFILEKIAE